MKFRDIKPYHGWGNYQVDVPLRYVPKKIKDFTDEYGLDMNPDFQRAHVWTKDQQTRYMEFLLRHGRTGRDLLFNSTSWMKNFKRDMLLVDGKQRIEAICQFFEDNVPVFDGHVFSDYEDKVDMMISMRFYVNTLTTRADILQWYIDLNAGGTVHGEDEIYKVRELLKEELKKKC